MPLHFPFFGWTPSSSSNDYLIHHWLNKPCPQHQRHGPIPVQKQWIKWHPKGEVNDKNSAYPSQNVTSFFHWNLWFVAACSKWRKTCSAPYWTTLLAHSVFFDQLAFIHRPNSSFDGVATTFPWEGRTTTAFDSIKLINIHFPICAINRHIDKVYLVNRLEWH